MVLCAKHLVISHESGLDELFENQGCTPTRSPNSNVRNLIERHIYEASKNGRFAKVDILNPFLELEACRISDAEYAGSNPHTA